MRLSTPEATPTFAKSPADFGRIVRESRKRSGLRQAQAAALCGVGTRFLSDLENGKMTLHLGKVLQVLQGFGLRVVIKPKTFADDPQAMTSIGKPRSPDA